MNEIQNKFFVSKFSHSVVKSTKIQGQTPSSSQIPFPQVSNFPQEIL